MADNESSQLAPPTNEDLRIAAKQFEYANRASAASNYDLAIQCLRTCCTRVPANLSYRQALRKAEKAKYHDNKQGSALAPLTTIPARLGLWRAVRRGDHAQVLEHGEAILTRNPWDNGAQLSMAESAAALGMTILAVWILQQARERDGKNVRINRALARLLEAEGHYTQSIHLWELVRQAAPHDAEAQHKAKQLGASETIARGNYDQVKAADPTDEEAPPTQEARILGGAAGEQTWQDIDSAADHYLQQAAEHWCADRFEEARAVLEKGVATLGPVFELTLAQMELEIEPLRRSLARAEKQLRAKPQDEKLRKTRGDLLAQINARELACYRLKVEHDATDLASRLELGVRLQRAGQVEEAICELQGVRSDAALQWKALLHLGHCFLARRNWSLAKRNFEEALKSIPGTEEEARKELLYHLAVGSAEAGEMRRAIEVGQELANQDFAYRNIGRRIEEWRGRGAGRPPVKPTGK